MKLQNIRGAWLLAALALNPAANALPPIKLEATSHAYELKGSFFNGSLNTGGRLSLDGGGRSGAARGAGFGSVLSRPEPVKKGPLAFIKKAAQRFLDDTQVAQVGDFKIKVRIDIK